MCGPMNMESAEGDVLVAACTVCAGLPVYLCACVKIGLSACLHCLTVCLFVCFLSNTCLSALHCLSVSLFQVPR